MTGLYFKDVDSRFSLIIEATELNKILSLCIQANENETGGILIGYYNESYDCAIVSAVTGPSDDSSSGRTWFYRGIKGLQKLVDDIWSKKRHYYLGEWHFHPMSSSALSSKDSASMRAVSRSSKYNCPEPILLIIGGNPKQQWTSSAYVFPIDQEKTVVDLVEVKKLVT